MIFAVHIEDLQRQTGGISRIDFYLFEKKKWKIRKVDDCEIVHSCPVKLYTFSSVRSHDMLLRIYAHTQI
jgi:hypothetical protein